jgi:gliding motility-associated-like protein
MQIPLKSIAASFVVCLFSFYCHAQKPGQQFMPNHLSILPPCSQLDIPDSFFACAGDSVQLIADLSQFTTVAGIQWTGGNGTFIPSDTVAQPIYVPSAEEAAAGGVNLILQVFTELVNQAGGSFLAYDHSGEDIIFYTNTQDGSIDIIQNNTGNDWTAMGFRISDNTLYGLSNIVTTPTLSSVNVQTGVVTPIFTYPNQQFYAGDYDNVNEIFYVIGMAEMNNGEPLEQFLYTVNLNTGVLETMGNLNLFATDNFFYSGEEGINGLAYDPSLEVLWAVTTNGSLLEINPENATVNSTVNTISELRGLAYDYNEDELWGVSANGTLYHINKFTGELIEEVTCQEPLSYVTSLTYAIPQNALDNICTDNTMIVIQNTTPPDLGADLAVCEGVSISLSVPGYTTYTWQDGSTVSTYIATTSGTYNVAVTDSFGCAASDEINIAFFDTPSATFTADPQSTTIAETEINFIPANPDETLQYSWTFESGTPQISDAINPVITFPEIPGNYEVVLVVSNEIGCSDTMIYTLIIESDGQINLPNIFTPNGDGDNDRFVPFEFYTTNWLLTIFNRWGNVIFETTNLAQGWNGEGSSAGTYYWILKPVAGQTGKHKSGYVMLVREAE